MNNRKRFIIFLIAWLMPMAMLAQTNHWTPVSAPYEDNMSLTGVIQINGVEQQSTALEVGAFCGTECRGSAMPVLFNVTGRYVFFLAIFGNSGDQITFKLYDHNQGTELNLQSPAAVTFGPNGLGSPLDPYVLNFTAVYTISVSANPSAGGTVSGGGSYNHGSTCTLTATPATGYNFVRWTKNGSQVSTSASYSFTVTESASYVAVFSLKSYTISASASPSAGGSVSGAGTYNHGSTCTLTATANTGYTFTNWTKNGTVVSTNANYSFTVTGNGSYVANFSQNTYTISASASPTAGGSVSGAGTYQHGSTCTLTATPNTGYNFVRWTKNGSQVSTSASYSFTVTESASYVAVFSLKSYTISASASPTAGGSVSGAGTYNHGSTCTLTATANTGYTFTNWTKNGTVVSTNANYSFTVTGNGSYVANFSQNTYTISASASPSAGGTVSGGGTYNHGSTCTLTATPATGYNFVRWTKNGSQVSTSASYSFTVTESASYVAVFSLKSYTISASASPTAGGSVSGAGTYNHGSTCTLTATANTGYTFTNWTKNGTVVSTNANYSFTVTSNGSYVANFSQNTYTISASASPTAGGSVSGAGTYQQGSTCTLTATPNTGYNFVRWTKNGSQVSTNASYSFTVTENASYVAVFSLKSYTISASASPTAGGSVSGAGTYNHGSTCTLTATANTGYTFTNWTKNGTVVSTNANYSFTVTGSGTYVANFSQNTYTISASASPTAGGTVSGGGTYNHGSTCTLTATPATGYNFVRWTKNGSQVSTSASYSFTVTESASYVAVFSLKSYTISASASPSAGGSVSGAGTYNHGSTCTLTATANAGYSFTDWTENGEVVSTEATYSFTVTGDRDLVANFGQNASCPTSLSDDFNDGVIDPELWTYTGNAVLEEDGLIKLQQNVTDQDVHLRSIDLHVPENGKVIMDRRFMVHHSYNYYNGRNTIRLNDDSNSFIQIEYVYTFYYDDSYHNDPKTGIYLITKLDGVVSEVRLCDVSFDTWLTEYVEVDFVAGTLSYYTDTFVAMVTIPGLAEQTVNHYNVEYGPWGWWTGHQHYMDYINVFAPDSSSNITATAEPADGGTVTGGGTFDFGQTCTLTATPNEGYTFLYWTENGVMVSLDANYSFMVTGDRNFVANFAEGESACDIVFDLFDSYGDGYTGNYLVVSYGGVTEQFTVESGSFASYSREIPTGSDISLSWIQGSWPEDCSFDIKFENDVLIYHGSGLNASFQQELNINCAVANAPYLISATANSEEGGSVVGSGIYDGGSTCTLTAIPNEGYCFYYWAENGEIISTETNYSFVVSANRDLLGVFGLPLIISATANPIEGGTVSGAGEYNYNSTCTLTATANDGYSFMYWTENGNQVSSDATYTFTVTSSRNLMAHFSLPLTINVAVESTEGGTATGSGVFDYGSTCTLTATANPGYLFSYWTKNGNVVSCFSPYSFTVTENADYVAHFEVAPEESVCIGNPESGNQYLPSYSYFNYTLSQQIYTASEIGTSGLINSVSFFNCGAEKTRIYDVYMVHTEKTTFDSNTDWIAVTEANRVFSGTVTMTANAWTTLQFDIPFAYNGTSNLALIVDDNSGYWNSPSMQCRVYHTEGNQAIRVYSDGTNYDPYNPSGYGGTRYSEKNQIILGFSSDAVLQFIYLLQGWNTFSTYFSITLDDLKRALVDALPGTTIKIQSQSDGLTIYNGTRWRGQLTAIDLAQMYMIEVAADCEIMLHGTPVNPAEHPVTIHNGINWIAFPFSQSMTLTNAFAGFAVNGDMVISQSNGTSTYSNRWRGQLNTLVPGLGYMYKSNVLGDRIFTFPVNSK